MPVVIDRPVGVEWVSRTKGVAMIAVTSELITFLTRFFPCFTPTLSLWTRESKRFQNLFSRSPSSGPAPYFLLLSSNLFSRPFFQIKISEKKSLKKNFIFEGRFSIIYVRSLTISHLDSVGVSIILFFDLYEIFIINLKFFKSI